MGKFLTDKAEIYQLDKPGLYRVLKNELYKDDDGSLYLCWRGFETDNFTWINSNEWDIRCSHIHDVGCKYHQLVKVRLNEAQLRQMRYLIVHNDKIILKNVPAEFLEVIDVSGNEINNLFYRMLKATAAPKYVQVLYRAGVALNFGWFLSGKKKINLATLYEGDK